jgi:imidazole glycerol phosphate synthase subunit HisF
MPPQLPNTQPPKHFVDVFTKTTCSAAWQPAIFLFGEIPVTELKRFLAARNIDVRL